MRLRNVPGSREAIAESEYTINEPELNKGKWKEIFGNDNPIRIEIGMGKGKFIMEITKATTMGEMLQYDMGIAYVLMEAGMHCVGCPSSIGESLEEACMVHGLNADEVMANIQEYLNAKKESEKAE